MQNNINSPIDFCKKNIDDLFNERKTIILYGETGTGKSTIITVGLQVHCCLLI